jgi:hypothetical protein
MGGHLSGACARRAGRGKWIDGRLFLRTAETECDRIMFASLVTAAKGSV